MRGRWHWLFLLGILGYLLVDGHPESWLSGLPWRPPSLMLAVLGGLACWAFWPRSEGTADRAATPSMGVVADRDGMADPGGMADRGGMANAGAVADRSPMASAGAMVHAGAINRVPTDVDAPVGARFIAPINNPSDPVPAATAPTSDPVPAATAPASGRVPAATAPASVRAPAQVTTAASVSDRAARFWPSLAVAVCALAIAKGVVGWQALPNGLPGSYFANSRFQGDYERSTEFLGEPWTRREREIFFGGDEFPAYFLNDVQRFNYFGAEADRRRNQPFSARWEGSLYVPADGSYQFWLTASGPGSLRIDDRQVAMVDADGRETVSVTVPLAQGSHPIRVQYSRRPPRSPDIKVEWEIDGRRRALAVPYLFPNAVTPATWERDRTVLAASRGLDGVFLTLAGAGLLALVVGSVLAARRRPETAWPLAERFLLGVVAGAIFLNASVPRLDRVDKLELLGGGQDWLTHESFARDILIGGPLMTLGKPLGEGRTFYAQPFYPYALAAMHALTGEDLFGVVALQVFGSGLAGVLLYYLARRLFGVRAALATFGLFLPLWSWHLEWVANRLISEAIYFLILPALLLVLVRSFDERRTQDFVLAGLLLGLAIVTRGPTLLYVPFVGAILWWGLRRAGLTRALVARHVAVLLVVAGLAIGLVPLRNQLVAGDPAVLASSGGVNFQKLHRPTNGVRLSLAQDRWFAAYIGDAPTRETVEFMLQDPGGYLYACLLLAAYTLGYGAAVEESTIAVWPELIALNALYLLAILVLAGARTLRSSLLHAFVLIHFATMVIFVPYDYDNRLVLPMYLPIAVFAGYAIAEALTWLVERVRGGAPRRAVLAERQRS